MDLPLKQDQSLVLFDGECAVCDAGVLYIIDHDPEGRFVFAPLQSEIGARVLREQAATLGGPELDSMVLYDGTRAYAHSTAVLRIARELRGPARLAAVFWLVPRFIRDALYRAFAARRKRWFGTLDQCRVPSRELRERFLG